MRINRTFNQVLLAGSACVALFAAAPIAWGATTSLITAASPNNVTLSVFPVTLSDAAILSGGSNPTGNINFVLFGPGNSVVDTETVTVHGNGTYTTPAGEQAGVAGTYGWIATYNSGDPNNNMVISSLEPVSVGSSVPEPSTWAMMLLGFAGLGFVFRQSRRKVSMA